MIYANAQAELFRLAQAICAQVDPCLQQELDALRTEIMAQINIRIQTSIGARVVSYKTAKIPPWYEVQITPEITTDPTIAGSAILPEDLLKLSKALRAQHAVVRRAIEGRL